MKKYFILMVMCWAFSVANADIKRPKSYNYTRGLEEYQQDNLDEAMKFFDKEIQENPKNGYTYMWKGIIHYGMSENGQALNALNTSLKYLPKKDAEFVAATYNARAMVYMALEDTVKALDDYSLYIM